MGKGQGKGVGRLECLPLARPFFLAPTTSNYFPPRGWGGWLEWLVPGVQAVGTAQRKTER